jgi:hypothetical protein
VLAVDFSEFMVFLLLQKFIKYHPSAEDEGSVESEELLFVRDMLGLILMAIQDPWKNSEEYKAKKRLLDSKTEGTTSRVSNNPDLMVIEKHEFDRLGLIFAIAGDSSANKDVLLSSIAPFWPPHSSSVTVSKTTMIDWIKRRLAGGSFAKRLPDSVRQSPGFIPYRDISNHTRTALVFDANKLNGGDVTISNCRDCSIYFTGHARFISVSNCSDCVLNLGAVGNLIHVRDCENVELTVATRMLHVSDCSHLTVNLFTSSRPVCMGSLDHIVLSPYNTFYPTLTDDLKAIRLNTSVNCWSSPMILFVDQQTSSR